MAFQATRSGDPERGPLIRLNRDEAALRLLSDGELVWLYGPRRHELATIEIDDTVPRGGVVLRDVPGVAASEIVRIVKPDMDRMDRGRNV
jgi:hypothetical protein